MIPRLYYKEKLNVLLGLKGLLNMSDLKLLKLISKSDVTLIAECFCAQ